MAAFDFLEVCQLKMKHRTKARSASYFLRSSGCCFLAASLFSFSFFAFFDEAGGAAGADLGVAVPGGLGGCHRPGTLGAPQHLRGAEPHRPLGAERSAERSGLRGFWWQLTLCGHIW